MTPTAWQRVGELFHQALEIPPERQTQWATEACAGDAELLHQLEALLQSDREARGGLEKQVQSGLTDFAKQDAESRIPKLAGPYRLVREIGRGGMGTVYLGKRDDEEYKIDVAVKLVTPGMDTDFVLQRFRRERQTLAGLNHPNIARLLDGGTTNEGLPYIVMEYVDGERITDYCRSYVLDLRQRLKLFLDVCAAVEHAHRRFVVHRDIKPGNILVTRDGIAKLLDFGICKVLLESPVASEETFGTARMLTPDYASPEQVRGEPVTVASDIYSLAAVLYELLTGCKLYKFTSLSIAEMERVVSEESVVPPSKATGADAARKQLAGDLDVILLRALAKDPARRYESVRDFAEDIERHLANVPVKARPDTFTYRAGKFLRRHRGMVIPAVLAEAALILGIGVAVQQARVANAQLQDTRQLANSVLFDIHDAVQRLPGSIQARQLIIGTGLKYLDSVVAKSPSDNGVKVELARGYLRIGELQGSVMNANLGQLDASLASLEKARVLLDAVLARDPGNLGAGVERVSYGHSLGNYYFAQRNRAKALEAFEQAARIGDPLIEKYPQERYLRRMVGEVHNGIGLVDRSTQRFEEAARHFERGSEILGKTPVGQRDDELEYLIAGTLSNLGTAETSARKFDPGIQHLHEAIAQMESLIAKKPDNTSFQHAVMLMWAHLADAYGDHGEDAKAMESAARFVEIARAQSRLNPNDQRAAADLGIALVKMVSYVPEPKLQDQTGALREALSILDPATVKNPKNAETRMFQAFAQLKYGQALAANGDTMGAAAAWNKALTASESLLDTGQQSPTVSYINACRFLGEAAAVKGDAIHAEQFAMRIRDAADPQGPLGKARTKEMQSQTMPLALGARGFIALRLGQKDRARDLLMQSAADWQTAAAKLPLNASLERERKQVEEQLASRGGTR